MLIKFYCDVPDNLFVVPGTVPELNATTKPCSRTHDATRVMFAVELPDGFFPEADVSISEEGTEFLRPEKI